MFPTGCILPPPPCSNPHLGDENSCFCPFDDKEHMKTKSKPQSNKDSDCVLQASTGETLFPDRNLVLYCIYLSIHSEDGLSHLESGSF